MRAPGERLQMEFRHEPCLEYRLQAESPLTNTRLKAELRTNNKTGRNSHSCRPRLILGNINRRGKRPASNVQCCVLATLSCWSINEYIWSFKASFFFFNVTSSNCSSSLG